MKQLMLGNKALARGLYEAGCSVVSSYPGTPSTEVTEEAAKFDEIYCEWAPNEKVALEVAYGAALAGRRSFCGQKHVGLNVAADPLFTSSYSGVNAGLVICVADDPGMHSSQNEQDSRHYAEAAKIPMLEPSDSAEALAFAKFAYELSEEYDVPVLLKMCTRIAHSQSVVETGERILPDLKPYVKDPVKNVMTPANAIRKHPVVEARTRRLVDYASRCPLNRVEMSEDTSLGIITSSTCYQYAKEVFGDTACILKLGMIWPLPDQLILDFAAKVDRLVVIEELDPFIENHCRVLGLDRVEGKRRKALPCPCPEGAGDDAAGKGIAASSVDCIAACSEDTGLFPMEGEISQNLIRDAFGLEHPAPRNLAEPLPGRPPVMCAGCPHRGLFYALSKNKCTVMGDIGCYTLGAAAPLNAMDMNLCMGASVSSLHGFNKARGAGAEGTTVAVIGDSTFMHSGMTGLANIAYNQSNSTVIILDNSITGMTGHQQNPTTGYNIKGDPAGRIDLEALCRAMGIERVRVVDPYDLEACDAVLKEELAAPAPSVIISRRPCALLKYVQHRPPLVVDTEKCVGCRACMKVGCPAISVVNRKAVIDNTLCLGCNVCSQLCRFGALPAWKKEEHPIVIA